MPMKTVLALAGFGLHLLTDAKVIKPVRPFDCSDFKADGYQVFTKDTGVTAGDATYAKNDLVHTIVPINLKQGIVSKAVTINSDLDQTPTGSPDTDEDRIHRLDACGLSPKTGYMYCSAQVVKLLTNDATDDDKVFLVRVGSGQGDGVAFCARYDMDTDRAHDRRNDNSVAADDGKILIRNMMPTAGDVYMSSTKQVTYYASQNNIPAGCGANGCGGGGARKTDFLWSFADPDSLECYVNWKDIADTYPKMKLETNSLGTDVGHDFVVRDDGVLISPRALGGAGGGGIVEGVKLTALTTSDPKGTFTWGGTGANDDEFVAVFASGADIFAFYSDADASPNVNNVAQGHYKFMDALNTDKQVGDPTVKEDVIMGNDNFPKVRAAPDNTNRFGPTSDGAYCRMTPCTCDHGTSGGMCPINSPQRCSECDEGHTLVDGDCSTCDAGYHLDLSGSCVPNECGCTNGIAGSDCAVHATQHCVECNHGYALTKNDETGGEECTKAACTCKNGYPMTGEDCTMTGKEMCRTCISKFHREGHLCVANQCHCTGGEVDMTRCVHHLQEMCSTCSDGYSMVANHHCVESSVATEAEASHTHDIVATAGVVGF